MATRTKEKAAPLSATLQGVEAIPIAKVVLSPFNPRKTYDEAALTELADSIRQSGLLQPVLVRPLEGGQYELIAGQRRWRAVEKLGGLTITAVVRVLTDPEAAQAAIVENLQREDMDPLDEADAFRDLLAMPGPGGRATTIEEVAERVGKSPRYVARRLVLVSLHPVAKVALKQDVISLGQALLIAPLSLQQQKEALDEFVVAEWADPDAENPEDAVSEWDGRGDLDDWERWIDRHLFRKLALAPFDKADATLCPAAGACTACPKRSGAQPLLFETEDGNETCLDAECFQSKLLAYVKRVAAQVEADTGKAPVFVSSRFGHNEDEAAMLGVKKIFSRDEVADAKTDCDVSTIGVLIDGEAFGKTVRVCLDRECPTHFGKHGRAREQVTAPRAKDTRTEEQKAEAKRAAAEQEIERRTYWQRGEYAATAGAHKLFTALDGLKWDHGSLALLRQFVGWTWKRIPHDEKGAILRYMDVEIVKGEFQMNTEATLEKASAEWGLKEWLYLGALCTMVSSIRQKHDGTSKYDGAQLEPVPGDLAWFERQLGLDAAATATEVRDRFEQEQAAKEAKKKARTERPAKEPKPKKKRPQDANDGRVPTGGGKTEAYAPSSEPVEEAFCPNCHEPLSMEQAAGELCLSCQEEAADDPVTDALKNKAAADGDEEEFASLGGQVDDEEFDDEELEEDE